jgi:hypothetical protein
MFSIFSNNINKCSEILEEYKIPLIIFNLEKINLWIQYFLS